MNLPNGLTVGSEVVLKKSLIGVIRESPGMVTRITDYHVVVLFHTTQGLKAQMFEEDEARDFLQLKAGSDTSR